MKKVIIAIIGFVAVVAIGLGVFLGLGLTGNLPAGFGFYGSSTNLEMVERRTWNAKEFSQLDVIYVSDGVTIFPSDNNEVVLEEYMKERQEEFLAKTQLKDGKLTITQGKRPWGLIMWDSFAYLYLPEDWQGELVIENTSGAIRTESNWKFADASFKNSSGSVRLCDITTEKGLTIHSTSGAISTGDITVQGDVDCKNSSGSIRLGNVTAASLAAKGTSGSIECDSATVQKEITMTNVSGAIRSGNLTAEKIELSGSSGSLSVDSAKAPTVLMNCTSGYIQVGTLEGKFTLDNSSGGIRVGKAYGEGFAKTTSSSVEVGMAQVTGDITLQSGSGRVQLDLPKSSFTANFSTGSGGIRTNFDDQLSFNKNGNNAEGTIGSNPAFAVNCSNTSGSIDVTME